MPTLDSVNISFLEKVPESPDEAWGTNASRTRRTYIVDGDADNRLTVARALLGYATVEQVKLSTGYFGYYVKRNLPHTLDYRSGGKDFLGNPTGDPFLYAAAITRTTPVGVGRLDTKYPGLSAYTKAFIEVEYRTHSFSFKEDAWVAARDGKLFDTGSGIGYPDEGNALKYAAPAGPGVKSFSASRYITRRFRPGSKPFEITAGMLRFVSDGAAVPRGNPIPEPWIDCLYTWNAVPSAAYPGVAIAQTLQTVNDDTFDGFPKGTLLFHSAQPEPAISPFGERILNITYGFRYSPKRNRAGVLLGHNAILRTVTNFMDYVQITDDGTATGRGIYMPGDFSALFRPDQS